MDVENVTISHSVWLNVRLSTCNDMFMVQDVNISL